jgi:hypothetical protein
LVEWRPVFQGRFIVGGQQTLQFETQKINHSTANWLTTLLLADSAQRRDGSFVSPI